MINFLLAIALILFVVILIVYLVRIMNENIYISSDFDEEVETTTTTTTTTTTVTEDVPEKQVTIDDLPALTRFFKPHGQPYCIDPVDGTEWMLNTKDDMYEDAGDKWWRLVDETPNTTK